jgi:hypothetical protein
MAAAVPVGSQTPLFVAIKEHKWEQVLTYLRSGQWPTPNNAEEVPPPPGDQCKLWVVDDNGVTRLPLHKAIVEEAPAIVLKRILGLFPAAIQARDSAHLLPIQLAVTVATSDQALFTLLDAWPHPGIVPPPPRRETRDDRPDDHILHRRRHNSSWSNSTRKHYRNLLLEQIKYAVKSKHPSDVWKQVLGNLELDLDCHDHIKTIIGILMMHRKQKLRQKSRQFSMTMEQNVPKSLWQAPVVEVATRRTPSAPDDETKDNIHRGRGRHRHRRCRSVSVISKE